MTRFFMVVTLISIIISACNNKTDNTTVANDSLHTEPVIVVDTAIAGCYSYTTVNDTAALQLQVRDSNLVSGQLSYNLKEKDRNDGSIQGEIKDGVLYAWYLFRSEGIISVRQEIFQIQPDKLVPATGNYFQRNDTMLFDLTGKLSFDSARGFKRVPCLL